MEEEEDQPQTSSRCQNYQLESLTRIESMKDVVATVSGYRGLERFNLMKLIAHSGASSFWCKLILVCWKYEGKKFELAEKLNSVVVNHRWIEDCIKQGKRLPEHSYVTQSGQEVGPSSLEAPLLVKPGASRKSTRFGSQAFSNPVWSDSIFINEVYQPAKMKLHNLELPIGNNANFHKRATLITLASVALLFLTVTSVSYFFFTHSISSFDNSTAMPYFNDSIAMPSTMSTIKCDIFSGEWIPNPEAPYYTNVTCWAIHDHQNCMKYGRPDSEYTQWRWKPKGCELPIFNPAEFLELVRGKSMAFVGDSIGRNHMQSLICLLSRVEYPIDVSLTADQRSSSWRYRSYNFTLASIWTPYLVKSREADSDGPTHTGLFSLYLDEFDVNWITQIEGFDYVIINGGHWFFRPSVYYENRKIVGCHYCLIDNITNLPMSYGYRKAFKTAFKGINNLENYKGITYLRTFSPPHFENGLWNEGGNCLRTRPFRSNETKLEGVSYELYLLQLEELRIAQEEGREKGMKFRLLDITAATLLRPDGHPSRYGHWPNENVTLYNDCIHWCLPGPVDTWNDFLLEILKREATRSVEERLYLKSKRVR